MKIDVRHLLRIPEDYEIPEEDEDEFKCLNLEITCPPLDQTKGPLPVLIWIHGMIVDIVCWTVLEYADRRRWITGCHILFCCIWNLRYVLLRITCQSRSYANVTIDPKKLIADSIKHQKSMVFVSINYRLNIFAFGDGKEKNLALKDQRLGIEWVRKNIASFGGDPVSSTLISKAYVGSFS